MVTSFAAGGGPPRSTMSNIEWARQAARHCPRREKPLTRANCPAAAAALGHVAGVCRWSRALTVLRALSTRAIPRQEVATSTPGNTPPTHNGGHALRASRARSLYETQSVRIHRRALGADEDLPAPSARPARGFGASTTWPSAAIVSETRPCPRHGGPLPRPRPLHTRGDTPQRPNNRMRSTGTGRAKGVGAGQWRQDATSSTVAPQHSDDPALQTSTASRAGSSRAAASPPLRVAQPPSLAIVRLGCAPALAQLVSTSLQVSQIVGRAAPAPRRVAQTLE